MNNKTEKLLLVGGPTPGLYYEVTKGIPTLTVPVADNLQAIADIEKVLRQNQTYSHVVYKRTVLHEGEKRIDVFFAPDGDEGILEHLVNAYGANDGR